MNYLMKGISIATGCNESANGYTGAKSWLDQLKILLVWPKMAGNASRLKPVPLD